MFKRQLQLQHPLEMDAVGHLHAVNIFKVLIILLTAGMVCKKQNIVTRHSAEACQDLLRGVRTAAHFKKVCCCEAKLWTVQ